MKLSRLHEAATLGDALNYLDHIDKLLASSEEPKMRIGTHDINPQLRAVLFEYCKEGVREYRTKIEEDLKELGVTID